MAHPYRLIVFDFDGTLVDSQRTIVEAMSAAFADHGLDTPTPEAVRRVVGLKLEAAAARLLPEPADLETAGRLADSYRRAYRVMRADLDGRERLFPGVREMLAELDTPQVCLGIATGKGRRGLLASLERHGLSEYFVTLQTADDGPGKPHPALLHQAMAEVGAEREATVLIGDTTFDMQMAMNAGVGAIGVAWGYHPPAELIAHGAARVIDSFTELAPGLSALAVERA